MQKQLVMVIAIAVVMIGGSIWVVNPEGFFSLIGQSESVENVKVRQVVYLTGRDSPAGECVVCHSLEKNGSLRVAPTLWGIVGAPKAGVKGYGYSVALAQAGGKWTEGELNRYLTDPDGFLPGTKKTIIGLPDDEGRAELIEYLATLTD